MTANLLTSPNQKVYGSITSGGSESLILSIHTYKNYYSDKTKPNMYLLNKSELFPKLYMLPWIKVASTSMCSAGRPE